MRPVEGRGPGAPRPPWPFGPGFNSHPPPRRHHPPLTRALAPPRSHSEGSGGPIVSPFNGASGHSAHPVSRSASRAIARRRRVRRSPCGACGPPSGSVHPSLARIEGFETSRSRGHDSRNGPPMGRDDRVAWADGRITLGHRSGRSGIMPRDGGIIRATRQWNGRGRWRWRESESRLRISQLRSSKPCWRASASRRARNG